MEIVENLNRRYIKNELLPRDAEGVDGYRIRMIQSNKILGMLRVDRRYLDGRAYLYYDITGMQSMQEKKLVIDVAVMNRFVGELEQLLCGLEEYLLRQQEICLLPENIWCDEREEKWKFLYIPEYGDGQKEDIERLLEFLMDHIDSRNENGLERFYSFYSDALQCLELLNISEIVRLWRKWEREAGPLKRNAELQHKKTEEHETQASVKQQNSVLHYESEVDYKGKIYTVPFHGTKVCQQEEVTLT